MHASAPELTPSDPGTASLFGRAVALVADDLHATERRLHELVHSEICPIPEIGRHLLGSGGKRLRPLLTLLCARAVELADPARITIAAVAELLHTATLLHDDVVDAGEFRRGRPAARVVFGNGLAVLTGDFCLARSLRAVAATGRAVAITSMAETVTRMAEGEVAQLYAAGDGDLDRRRYDDIVERKTGALIAWCTSVAGLPDPAYVAALASYGHHLGFAFQIADDVLDLELPVEGQKRLAAGKEPGQDLRDGKLTLPLLLGCEADSTTRELVRTALRRGPPMDPEVVSVILHRLARTEAVTRARSIADEHAEQAVHALRPVPPSAAREALAAVAHAVVRRSW